MPPDKQKSSEAEVAPYSRLEIWQVADEWKDYLFTVKKVKLAKRLWRATVT